MHIPKVLIVTDTDATWMAQIFPQKRLIIMYANVNTHDAYACNARTVARNKKNEPKIKDWYFSAPKAHKKPDRRHFMKLCTIFERNVK